MEEELWKLGTCLFLQGHVFLEEYLPGAGAGGGEEFFVPFCYEGLNIARMGLGRCLYPKNDRKTIPDEVVKNNWIHATFIAI